MSSKSQFRSAMKTRESMKNLKTVNNFNNTQGIEGGDSKNNFYNMRNSSNKNINDPNYNSDPNNMNTKNRFYMENNPDRMGTNSSNPGRGFNPAIRIENDPNNPNYNGKYKSNGRMNDNYLNDPKNYNNIFNNIKPEVFNYNQKLTEKELDRMLQDYRGRLNSELLKILTEEKHKEEEREVLYNNTIDIIEKKRLEKIISMERAQSSERILKINEYNFKIF